MDLIGKRMSDRYEIISLIGVGGMAHVYKANDIILERFVAVKILQPQFNADNDFIRRFHREAQAATSLHHPHIVNIYDVGEDEDTYYIVMEYVEGITLKEKITQEGPLPVEEAVEIMKQVLGAIEQAHANRVVHRDLKPQNILIENSTAKVADFGIARAASSATITHTNSVIGSVHYLSPEQAKGSVITHRADIYSLGILLFEMVTGSLPFKAESAVSIALMHIQESIPMPTDRRYGLPQSIENIILRAVEKDPDDRYQTAFSMKEDLQTSLQESRKNEAPYIGFYQTLAMASVYTGPDAESEETKILPVQAVTGPREDTSGRKKSPSQKNSWFLSFLIVLLLVFASIVAAFTFVPEILSVEDVNVPELEGLHADEALERLENKGLAALPEEVTIEDRASGETTGQLPAAGSSVKKHSEVTIYVNDLSTMDLAAENGSREQNGWTAIWTELLLPGNVQAED
ncbi:serine/threonine-protein kinase [Sinobaca qinghaiensis]|uniref:Serine/threonine-protein kinase PrkC n=1 Tax=Sinobaca qinghaiensis TaxID=342944 RepID=A0A419V606_9BACL|nr:Stk1 family PASTA domain-containing Ser/Thr kinase [Sinobaca qinghaiensis]RKD75414.1 serine/threonine-protein kinase [Sinobaca qinghaiensis]